MKPLVSLFWQICLLRRGPEAMPVSTGLLGFVIIANLTVSFILAFNLPEALVVNDETVAAPATPLTVLASILVSQATFAAGLWFATTVRNFVGRFPATATAYFGCDLIVTLIILFVVQLTPIIGIEVMQALLLVIVIWSIAITGFIIQRALSTSTAIGLGVALGIMVMSFTMSAVITGS